MDPNPHPHQRPIYAIINEAAQAVIANKGSFPEYMCIALSTATTDNVISQGDRDIAVYHIQQFLRELDTPNFHATSLVEYFRIDTGIERPYFLCTMFYKNIIAYEVPPSLWKDVYFGIVSMHKRPKRSFIWKMKRMLSRR